KHDHLSAGCRELGGDIADTIKQATLFGRGWSDALKSIGVELAQLVIKMIFFKNAAGSPGGGGGIGSIFGSLLGGLFGGGKASGGPVDDRHFYMVGEHGPEMFVPRGTGSIVPASRGSSDGKQTVVHQ